MTTPRPIDPQDIRPGMRVRVEWTRYDAEVTAEFTVGENDANKAEVTTAGNGPLQRFDWTPGTWTLLADAPEPPTPEFAHIVAPDVDGSRFIGDADAKGVAAQKFAYHAARAYGFMEGWKASKWAWDESLLQAIAEYELAWVYSILVTLPDGNGDAAAADIASRLASPQVIQSDIADMLTSVKIDPASIKPYGRMGDPR